jgi:hypothetical protein
MTPPIDDTRRLARRARLQLILAAVGAALTLLALAVPMWIEEFTTLEPDGGNGELEWLLPIPFAVATIALGGLSYRTRTRLARLGG